MRRLTAVVATLTAGGCAGIPGLELDLLAASAGGNGSVSSFSVAEKNSGAAALSLAAAPFPTAHPLTLQSSLYVALSNP